MKTTLMKSAAAIAFGCALMAGPALADDMNSTQPSTTQPSTTEPSTTQPSTTQTEPSAAQPTLEQQANAGIKASEVIGTTVQSPDGESVGEVSELVLDNSGQTQGVVVDVGGFLGVGAKPVLLSWNSLNWSSDDDGDLMATTSMTREQIEGLQAYEVSTN